MDLNIFQHKFINLKMAKSFKRLKKFIIDYDMFLLILTCLIFFIIAKFTILSNSIDRKSAKDEISKQEFLTNYVNNSMVKSVQVINRDWVKIFLKKSEVFN